MKRVLFIIILPIFISLSAKGQSLFFIGEKSYPCTESFTLQVNSNEYYLSDLNVLFAKDGEKALFAVSTKTIDVIIRGKLIIYLNDGIVIILNNSAVHDYVNKIASSVYYLTNEELIKLKKSNINTIRYTLAEENGASSPFGGNFSASNETTNFPSVITEFFDK